MGSGKDISRASTHPLSISPSSPSPRVGKITTQPGLRGRGEPGASVGKQMSPLAAASASGERCAGGPSRGHSPPTSQASRSQLPRLGGGVFFRLSVSRVQLFYLGAVLTRPRLADVKMQPLHDSVSRDRGRGREGAHSTFRGASAAPAARKEPVLQAASRVAREGFCPSEAGRPRTQKKTRVPRSSCTRGGCGKRGKRGQRYTVIGVTFWAVISLGCQ